MCRKPVLRNVVHLGGTDLHLDGQQGLLLLLDALDQHRLMQGLVAVGLLDVADEVLGALGQGAEELLHRALRDVAVVLVARHDHAQRNHVVDLGGREEGDKFRTGIASGQRLGR